MKKLSTLIGLLLLSLNSFAQLHLDEHGYPVRSNSSSIKAVLDINYNFIDSLPLPAGFSPRPGQFSKDGLEYYLSLSFNYGKSQLYVLKRTGLGKPFGSPQLLAGVINDSIVSNHHPSITADKKTVVFARATESLWTKNELYIATRSDISLPFDSVRPLIEFNSPDTAEAYPWISPDGLRLYFTKGTGENDEIVISTRNSQYNAFGPIYPLKIDFNADKKFSCWLTDDELELYFTTGRYGDSAMYAIRTNPSDWFLDPEFLPSISKYGFISGISVIGNELYLFNPIINGSEILIFQRGITSAISGKADLPIDFSLNQNYPNPFNPTTRISYFLNQRGSPKLRIFDSTGRVIGVIELGFKSIGQHLYKFDGSQLSSGTYFYQIEINGTSKVNKMHLIK